MLARENYGFGVLAARSRQRFPETRDVDLYGLRGGRGGPLAPQLVDQPLHAERFPMVHQEQCKQSPLLPPRKRNPLALVEDLEGTQDAKLHVSQRCEAAE